MLIRDDKGGIIMAFTAAALRELHRIHRQLTDLRERLDRGPKQVKARQAAVAAAEERLAKSHAETKAARVAVDQKQLLLRTGEGKIIDLKVKLNACSTNREYQTLRDQILADEMANSVLADEILEALEKVDQYKLAIGEAEVQVGKSKEELAKVQQTVRSQEELLRTDVRRLEGELRTAEAALPAELREVYERVVKARGEDAMAQVEGESCGGCHQQLTPNIMSQLLGANVVFCKTCGRLLYLPEDRTPGRK
jgi:predicted  nucleic acid-binding Zn-ribbon protein